MDNDLRPAECFPVSETIMDELKARKWTRVEFALRFFYHFEDGHQTLEKLIEVVGGLLSGSQIITDEIANALYLVFGVSAQFWLNMDASYREWKDGDS